MSSISNESRRDDSVRRTKEEYYAKEAEDTRKHKTELRNLTEQYQQEVEDLKAEHAAKVSQLEGYMTARLSKQEQEHNRQMQDMRDIHTQQLRKKSEEALYLRDEQKEAYESQLEREKNIAENQRARQQVQFDNELEKKDEAFRNYAQFAREESARTWDQRREKLQKSTDDQLQRERSNHENQLTNVNRELSEVRKTKDSELKQVKLQNEFEKNRIDMVHRQSKETQEKLNAAVHESMADETKSQQALMKQKYREEIDQKIAEVESAQKDFRETTSERINRQLNALKSDVRHEKDERIVERTALERQHELEKKHLMKSYEDRLADQRYQKEEAIARVNQEVDSEVGKAVQSRDKMLKNLTDEHIRDRELTKAQNATQVAEMRIDMENTKEHITQRADSKVNRANELVRQNNVRLQKYYGDNLDLIKKDFMKELNDERIRHIDERAEIEGRLEKKVREREKSLTGELEQKVIAYEDRIEEQKERFTDELRRQDEGYREQIKARERNHKDAMDSLEMKYKNQIQQIKDSYANEMDSMDRRHRQEMNNLAQKMSERQRRS